MKKYTVYIISNTINDNLYVGITSKTIEERFKIHIMHSKSKCSNTENRSDLLRDMLEFGYDKFKIEIYQENLEYDVAKHFEKQIQLNDIRFLEYAKKDLKRNQKALFKSCYKLKSNIETLYFKTIVQISKHFNCHKTNVTRSLKDGYLFLKKYRIERISLKEYNENTQRVNSESVTQVKKF